MTELRLILERLEALDAKLNQLSERSDPLLGVENASTDHLDYWSSKGLNLRPPSIGEDQSTPPLTMG